MNNLFERSHFMLSENTWNHLQSKLSEENHESIKFEEDYFDTKTRLLMTSNLFLMRRYYFINDLIEWVLKFMSSDEVIEKFRIVGEQKILEYLKKTFMEFDDASEITDFCEKHILSLLNTRIVIVKDFYLDICSCSTLNSGFVFTILSCRNLTTHKDNKLINKLRVGPSRFLLILYKLYGYHFLMQYFSKSIADFVHSCIPFVFLSPIQQNPFSKFHHCIHFNNEILID